MDPTSPHSASQADSPQSGSAPHPLLKYQQTPAPGPDRLPTDTGPVGSGLQIISAILIIKLVMGLISGALNAQMMEEILRNKEHIVSSMPWMKFIFTAHRVLLLMTGAAMLYGLSMVARGSSEARKWVHGALIATGAELLILVAYFAIDLFLVGSELTSSYRALFKGLSLFGLLVDVIGTAFLLEAVLVLRRSKGILRDGTARVLIWGILVLRHEMFFFPVFARLLWDTSQWIAFGIRAVLNLGYVALMVSLVNEAIQAVRAKQAQATAPFAEDSPGAHTFSVESNQTLDNHALRAQGTRNVLFGILWTAGGLTITILSLQTAGAGGRYLVAYGAILAGIVQLIRGFMQLARAK